MRLIPISQYDETSMRLAKPVYDKHRRVLLAANHIIHPKYLEKLKEIGIRVLVVEDGVSEGITLEEMIDMPTWMDIIDHVREVFEAARSKKPVQLNNLLAGVGKLIFEVKKRPVIVPVPVSSIPLDLKLYAHSVNVALLSLQVGKCLGYNDLMLRDLAVGCLLHDIGKVLTEDYRKHPEAGFNWVRNFRELSLLSAHVAFQHHETMDGKGFPRGVRGEDFHEYAQICGVVNFFENLVTEIGVASHEAMEAVMAANDSAYSPKIVQAFVSSVPAYPPGIQVRLSNGCDALVCKITSHMQRPVVRYLATGEEISLADQPTLMVNSVSYQTARG
jgi:putative nucleotidyltransferase with HDIG domain